MFLHQKDCPRYRPAEWYLLSIKKNLKNKNAKRQGKTRDIVYKQKGLVMLRRKNELKLNKKERLVSTYNLLIKILIGFIIFIVFLTILGVVIRLVRGIFGF